MDKKEEDSTLNQTELYEHLFHNLITNVNEMRRKYGASSIVASYREDGSLVKIEVSDDE